MDEHNDLTEASAQNGLSAGYQPPVGPALGLEVLDPGGGGPIARRVLRAESLPQVAADVDELAAIRRLLERRGLIEPGATVFDAVKAVLQDCDEPPPPTATTLNTDGEPQVTGVPVSPTPTPDNDCDEPPPPTATANENPDEVDVEALAASIIARAPLNKWVRMSALLDLVDARLLEESYLRKLRPLLYNDPRVERVGKAVGTRYRVIQKTPTTSKKTEGSPSSPPNERTHAAIRALGQVVQEHPGRVFPEKQLDQLLSAKGWSHGAFAASVHAKEQGYDWGRIDDGRYRLRAAG